MSNSKKKPAGRHLSKKKVAAITPREYTIMGSHPDFLHFNPSHEGILSHPISHKLEKWILITLLAMAMAAFAGFKLLENSDLSFSVSDSKATPTVITPTNSLSNEGDFKNAFNKNRNDARALMQNHAALHTTPKYGKGAIKLYAHKTHSKKKLLAKKSLKKKHIAKLSRKKSVAKS